MDLISKQTVIEALRNLPRWIMDPTGEFQKVDPPTVSMINPDDATKAIENLSTELEIIQCKDCKYRGGLSGFYCDIVEKVVGVDSFCSWAERRKE